MNVKGGRNYLRRGRTLVAISVSFRFRCVSAAGSGRRLSACELPRTAMMVLCRTKKR